MKKHIKFNRLISNSQEDSACTEHISVSIPIVRIGNLLLILIATIICLYYTEIILINQKFHWFNYLYINSTSKIWLHCIRPGQTWSDTDLAKRRILCQIPSHVITTSRSPPLPSLENHLNFPEPNAPHRRSFYLFLFQTRVAEPSVMVGNKLRY